MTCYDIRIEPKAQMKFKKIRSILEEAFKPYGGLSEEGVECLNID